MKEDQKGFDAGDYNLFRYCHNDLEDLTDPMGLGGLPNMPYHWTPELEQAYNQKMAEAQWAMSDLMHSASGAIGIGKAGYNAWSAMQRMAAAFQAEVHRAIASGQRLAQVGNNFQPRTIPRSGYLRIDTDGTGPDHGDPTRNRANETAYQPNGRSLNADTDPYVAIPTALLRQGVRLGDRAVLTVSGRSAPGVVGDTGADPRFVEASLRLVHDVGVRTRDVPRTGPVPDTLGGREVWATMTLYPSGH